MKTEQKEEGTELIHLWPNTISSASVYEVHCTMQAQYFLGCGFSRTVIQSN